MPTVLTIAGSDSSAGAGIQADLKTFAALGVYGVSAITAVTAQDTRSIAEVYPLPPALVRLQIERVAGDLTLEAVKIGMLATAGIVHTVADALSSRRGPALVLDPVLAATSGGTLLSPDAVSTLKDRLLPLATVVTPNAPEAAVLSGIRVDSPESARRAGERILGLGPTAVVVTGGHLPGAVAVDFLIHAGGCIELAAPRVPGGAVHGTGCTFAAALAAGLALGDDVPAAARRAKDYVAGAIQHAVELGGGARILNHFWRAAL